VTTLDAKGLGLPIDLDALEASLKASALSDHSAAIMDATRAVLSERVHGDVPRWLDGLNRLPNASSATDLKVDLNADAVSARFTPPTADEPLSDTLKRLSPWRKGPFQIGDVHIDSEWRSDWKWQRIQHALSPLENASVLDVGCGNGYHLWRLRGAGANYVLGIDPSPLFVIQFLALQGYLQDQQVQLIPLTLEQFSAPNAFDTVLSMGVLSHRREPMEHLHALRRCLKPGGELLLETLVLPGDENQVMTIDGRYARMRNVWELPSAPRVQTWLEAAGFADSRIIDVANTSVAEQRTTEWMPFESLAEGLDPQDSTKTIEGHPCPCRAVLVAKAV